MTQKVLKFQKKKRSYKIQSDTAKMGSDGSDKSSNSSNLSTPPKSKTIDKLIDRPLASEFLTDYPDITDSFEPDEERDPRETTGNECYNDALMN